MTGTGHTPARPACAWRMRRLVPAITVGEGSARGQWVIVTREQTIGREPYTGLRAAPHVTRARVARHGKSGLAANRGRS